MCVCVNEKEKIHKDEGLVVLRTEVVKQGI